MINNKSMRIDKSMNTDNRSAKVKEVELLETIIRELEVGKNIEYAKPHREEFDYTFQDNRGRICFLDFRKMIPWRRKQVFEVISYYHLLSQSKTKSQESVWLALLVDFDFAQRESFLHEIENFLKEHKIRFQILFISTEYQFKTLGAFRADGSIHGKISLIEELKLKTTSIDKKRKATINFSPNQQWLLKHLLLNGLSRQYWMESNIGNLSGSTNLSEASGIAQSACHDLLKSLENLGYLYIDKNRYRFRNIRQLLQQWNQKYNKQGTIEIFASPRDPSQSAEDLWQTSLHKLPYHQLSGRHYPILFSGTPALSSYGLRLSGDFSLMIHSSRKDSFDLDELFRFLNLVQSDKSTSIKMILHDTYKPVLDVHTENQIDDPFVDILQLALDTAHFGGRGLEHSEKIYQKILYPFWTDNGWGL